MNKYDDSIKYYLYVSVIVYVLLSIYGKYIPFISSYGIVDNITLSITISLIIVSIYIKVLWKYNPINKTPNIAGSYSAKFISDFDRKKRNVNFIIKQDLFNAYISYDTKESESKSICSNLVEEIAGDWSLIYIYNNQPNNLERKHSEIHQGTCIMKIKNNKIVSGKYYTDRNTKGDIINIEKKKLR